uniref:Uncharacterized protein n=1 Tax=viral metagenome TaxID=1070528 RepID=A0A6M3MCE7_9ZZZZ
MATPNPTQPHAQPVILQATQADGTVGYAVMDENGHLIIDVEVGETLGVFASQAAAEENAWTTAGVAKALTNAWVATAEYMTPAGFEAWIVMCDLVTWGDVTRVDLQVEVSEDATKWFPLQSELVAGDGTITLADIVWQKVTSADDTQWAFLINVKGAKYWRVQLKAGAGTGAGSALKVTAKAAGV